MKKQLHHFHFVGFVTLLVALAISNVKAAQLSGSYTIDATQPASATNFQNLASAITFMTSASARSDAGPANSSPFGVSGAVTFNYATGTGPYIEQVIIPAITGASATNTITINGNGCTQQFLNSTGGAYHLIRLNGADHVIINNLKLKSTSPSAGWGIHFTGGADSNVVYGCTIDLTSFTSANTASAGIVFSGSTTSATSAGANGYGNLIMNDTILGSTAGGPYYGITHAMSNASVYSGNKFIGNMIQNVYNYGIYTVNSKGMLIKGNNIGNPTKTANTTMYGIYMSNGSNTDTITGNRIHDPFGVNVTTTSAFYGVYINNTNTVQGQDLLVTNNSIYEVKSNGSQYGFYTTNASNTRIFHNTISLDYAASTAAAGTLTYGLYSDNSVNGNGVSFQNNVVSVTRGGATTKVGAFLSTAGSYTLNTNNYYVAGTNSNVGYYINTYFTTLALWKAANNGVFDPGSFGYNPNYVNTAIGDLNIQEGMLNSAGANLISEVPTDANGVARTTTPDLGAYEFNSVFAIDAGIWEILLPAAPFASGKRMLSVRIKNAGSATLSGANVNWKLNGVTQTPVAWTGMLNSGQVATVNLDSLNFVPGALFDIATWTSDPNFTTDGFTGNDSLSRLGVYSALAGGTYTINSGAASSPSNFVSFTEFATALNGGILGQVTANVVANSGPYNEQVVFGTIPGASVTNNVVLNGNNETLQFAATSANYAQLRLSGTKHFTIQNLSIKMLGTQYGWGIHFINSADSNKVLNCAIDLTGVTTTSTANAGIVFSGSLTSPTTTGENGKGNLIQGNTITGRASGGAYYGIVHIPSASAATPSNNKFIGNTIMNFYSTGIYSAYTNGTLYKGNVIKNDGRTSFTTIYGIYVINGSRNDTIINNVIENPFGTSTTQTVAFSGIHLATPGTAAATPNLIANNVIRNVRSNGVQYGIYGSSASNNRIYHNTIILDNPTSTSSSFTYGIYLNGTPAANGIDVKNNIIYINRSITNVNYNIFVVTANANYSFNNNVYYKVGSGNNSNVASYGGITCNTFNQWRAVRSPMFDSLGMYVNPQLTDLSTNAIPREGALDAAGADVLSLVPVDFAGNARSATPDIGAYEFNVLSLDAAIEEINPPALPFFAGTGAVNVKIRNAGTTTLTGVTINWTMNGVLQTPYSWTGSLNKNDVSANINIGSGTFTVGVNSIKVWTSAPNGGSDNFPDNDSLSVADYYTTLATGTYTIDQNAAPSSTNFTSFNAAATVLNNGGVAGPVVINVVPGSGPYTEQVTFTGIPGATATNTVTINGNGQEINYNNTATSLNIIGLTNTKHVVLDNIRIRSLNATYGAGVILTNNSDSNVIQNCSIDMSSITGTSSTLSAGIALSASFTSVNSTSANNGSANVIRGNTIDGGGNNGCYWGIIVNGSNTASPAYSHNKVLNNTIKDFYVYGIYLGYSTRAAIKGNALSRPVKVTPTTFYGIYVANGSQADTIEANVISKPYGSIAPSAYSSNAYGIYFSSTVPAAATPSIIKNNVINDFKGVGTIYGIGSVTNAYIKIYHNTVNIIDTASASANVTSGIYSSGTATGVAIRNNIVNIEKGGTGNKYAIYLNTASTTGYTCNNNNLRCIGASNAYVGYYPSTSYATLANWKTANGSKYDSASVSANPLYRNLQNPIYLEPGNDTLDNIGANLLTDVPVDIMGMARTATPDPGAYGFSVYPNDAGIVSFYDLGANATDITPVSGGNIDVYATVKNYGTATLGSGNIEWSVAGMPQLMRSFSGAIAKGDTNAYYLGTITLGNGINEIKAWTTSPNSTPDLSNQNDTLSIRVCTPISGSLTVNALWPDTGSNFTSFTSVFNVLAKCGVSGPVTINVSAGTYAQQLTVPNNIPGQSNVNTVTLDGGDSATCIVTHTGAGVRPTLLLDGARNFVFRNMKFIGTGTTSATAVQLINMADSNTFVKCAFIVPNVTSAAVNAFVASGSTTSATTGGNAANYLLVDSCSTRGGYYGGFILYGSSTQQSVSNTIRNSYAYDSYSYGMYVFYQNGVALLNNTVQGIGTTVTPGTVYGIYISYCDNGNQISGNRIYNLNSTSSIYGLYTNTLLGDSLNRTIIANNTVDVGNPLQAPTYGLYDYNNKHTDIVYNTVRSNSADAQYIYPAYYHNNTTPASYYGCRVMNNIFVSPNGALSVYFVNQANVFAAQYTMDNNVFYSSNLYPWRVQGFITNTLNGFATSPNMLGGVVGNNASSLFLLPQFDSKLKSITPLLDEAGVPVSTVTVDIEGNLRNATMPDIGAYEFDKTADDAGVTTILSPVKPLVPGLNDIKVAIRNYGLNTLTTCEVSYQIGSTVHTKTYFGNLATLAYDTVVFDATSGFGGTSQQYNFTGAIETVKVWTSLPNGNADSIPSNDTAYNTLCTGIAGTYTIDPAGSGPNNFTSIQAAIDKLDCGGVYGHVVFEIAPGTYNGQYLIPTISGTSDTSTITFKSANNLASSVTLTSSPTATATNYTFYLRGASYINFEALTLQNTSATFGRVVTIGTYSITNVTSSNISFRNCIVNGQAVTSTSDAFALIYTTTGNTTPNLSFANNTFNNGSMGIYAGGPNIVNQFSAGITVDSNTFNNQYYYGLYMTSRSLLQVRRNVFNMSPTSYYGIYNVQSGFQSVISENTINSPAAGYGIYTSTHAYYNQAGELAIRNNVINMTGSTGTQYGIGIYNSSYIDILHNTVKLSSASTSYGLYLSGHASFVNGVTTYPPASYYTVKNNIFRVQEGFAFYSLNVNSDSALATGSGVNRNLYYSSSADALFGRTANYGASSFAAYRNLYQPGSDMQSVFNDVVFTSANNLKPNETHSSVWNVNGRAEPIYSASTDFTGAARSALPSTGTPDIGAYEVVPMAEPLPATITGTTAYGNTQAMLVNGDTVAWITWSFAGVLPTTLSCKYYPGSAVSHPAQFGNMTYGHVLDALWKIQQTGGSGYLFDIKFKYDPLHLGTVPSESEIRHTVLDSTPFSFWNTAYSTSTLLDTVEKTFGAAFQSTLYLFTGTSDLSPLPVKLASFNAAKTNRDALVNWVTASERNMLKYEVERSEDGSLFNRVGEVRSVGNSTTTMKYSFTDAGVADRIRGEQAFYRLKMINRDGSFEYSEIRKVVFGRAATLTVYPNPFSETVTLQWDTEINDLGEIIITDIFGKEVATVTSNSNVVNNRVEISELTGLSAGVYIIKARINGTDYTHKVVKQ